MSKPPNRTYWYLCIAVAVLLTIVTFTPLVIPAGEYRPTLLGMPYTLWMTVLITALYVVLTYIGTRVHPGRNDDDV